MYILTNREYWNQNNDSVDSPPVILVKATFQNHWIIAAVIFWPADLFGVLIPPFFLFGMKSGEFNITKHKKYFYLLTSKVRGRGSVGTAWGQRGHNDNPTVWQYPTEMQIQGNCPFPGIYNNLCMSS